MVSRWGRRAAAESRQLFAGDVFPGQLKKIAPLDLKLQKKKKK